MTDAATIHAQANAAYNQKNWQQALTLANSALQQVPNHAELHYLAGISALALQQMPPALYHLQRAVDLYPERAEYATQFAKALSLVNMSAEATIVAEYALTLTPLDAHTLDTLGVIFTRANAHDRATALYDRAVTLAPNQPDYRYNFARSLVFVGDMDTAERELETCIDTAPWLWGAYLTLSQLRKQSRASNHLDRLHALIPKTLDNPAAQMNLHLSLAKEYEDLAEYSKSFEHLVASKRVGSARRSYSSTQDEALFGRIISASPTPQPASAGFATEEPIFILGMPRSGTTLVERIVSSHPDVHAAGELQNFPLALKRASGSRTPNLFDADTITRSQDVDWRKLGEDYLSSTRPDTGSTPHFIDKLPHNFLYLGAIANALPNAKIICLRRDPIDTCLSNFRQLFGQNSAFHDYSYDLLDTGRYYVLFDRLMAHWKQQFPGRILEVDYETLVENQEGSTWRLLQFCNLTWNDACLNFQNNEAPATTASAVQVRAPMYSTAVQRWKLYEKEMVDLRKLLIASGIELTT